MRRAIRPILVDRNKNAKPFKSFNALKSYSVSFMHEKFSTAKLQKLLSIIANDDK